MGGSCATQQKRYHETTTTESCHLPTPSPLITNTKYLCAGFADSRVQLTDLPVLHKKTRSSSTPSLSITPVETDFHFHLSSDFALPSLCTQTVPHPLNTRKRRVIHCLENGIRSKLFLLIRHLSGRAASGALDLEGCYGLY